MNERIPYPLRAACRCGATMGHIRETGSQDCVYCNACDRFQYNAPRAETGKPIRSVRSARDVDISPSLRAEILIERAGGVCEICHRADVELHVAHLLSVEQGRAMGLTDDQINDPENLAAMCCACNLGLGSRPVSARLMVSLIMSRTNRKVNGG